MERQEKTMSLLKISTQILKLRQEIVLVFDLILTSISGYSHALHCVTCECLLVVRVVPYHNNEANDFIV